MKMNLLIFSTVLLFSMVNADDPIVHLSPKCPALTSGKPAVVLRADVPAHAVAKCKNGNKPFITTDDVEYRIQGSFRKSKAGKDCLFFKKNGSNTFTVEVAVGWGEEGSEVMQQQLIHTISCAYDKNGKALTTNHTIADGFIAPHEMQNLQGSRNGTFELEAVDVLDQEITAEHFHLGRKMRLRAVDTSGTVAAFRALSCTASNGITSYAILRAGCGDGLVFPKTVGFQTVKAEVYSPYFDAFKLRGANVVKFECNFTVCETNCDGDSCTAEKRKRRSISDGQSVLEGASSEQMIVKTPMLHDEPVFPAYNQKSPSLDFGKIVNAHRIVNAHSLPGTLQLSPEKSDTQDLQVVLVMSVFGSLLLVTFILALYLCCKYEIVKYRYPVNV